MNLSQAFRIENSDLRGRIIRLGSVLDTILKRHDYPDWVNEPLAELLVLASAFAGSLKFDGRFSLQIRGDGPVTLMVADCTNNGAMRGYASFDEAQKPETQEGQIGLTDLFGNAVLAIVVDQAAAGTETYQGIVPLSERGLTQSVRGYFWQSEQLPTGLFAVHHRVLGEWRGGAIILQSLPMSDLDLGPDSTFDNDEWRTAMVLLETVKDSELLDPGLEFQELLWRVFHEQGVRIFDPMTLEAGCRCSSTKVQTVLDSFDVNDLNNMRTAEGGIDVTCEFCGKAYCYGSKDVDRMIADRSH